MKKVETTIKLGRMKDLEVEPKEVKVSVSMPFLDDSIVYKSVSFAAEFLALILAKIAILYAEDRQSSYQKTKVLIENISKLIHDFDKKK